MLYFGPNKDFVFCIDPCQQFAVVTVNSDLISRASYLCKVYIPLNQIFGRF